MSDPGNNPEPKIIVDEDWKSQVAQEKQKLQESPDVPPEADGNLEELPPASLLTLISMFATQAMAALGLLVDPSTGQGETNRPVAKHFIDLLGLIQEKTAGNVTEEEAGHLRDALHQLRMVYVQTANQPGDEGPGEPPKPASSIELP